VILGRRAAARDADGWSSAGDPVPSAYRGPNDAGDVGRVAGYASLVAAIGVGSLVQHGPNPAWADVAHDAPLLATLVFVAADDVAVLTGRRRAWWWWAAPTVALLPVVVAAPRAGDLAQAAIAAIAVALTLARARAVPGQRRTVGWSVGALAVGAVIGSLSRAGGPLCVPDSLWQGHAAWHVLASLGLTVLGAVVGRAGPVSHKDVSEASVRAVPG
jgi:hypothetical protein